MSKNLFFLASICCAVACRPPGMTPSGKALPQEGQEITLSKATLMDKVKGGWAGQVIGCTYGGPTEFQYNGTMIGDHIPIPWDDQQMTWWYKNAPGLYDDIYMDLTFVDVFEKHGFDAPDSLHALAFARAPYPLWHANQAARYNILNGMMPPASGFWKNNPHSEDIDFQIEADFAGLMAPGMARQASDIANRIGHIMNYGDGVYGGIYVANMYALAYVYDDIKLVVKDALAAVPEESEFYQCITDVIRWHEQYPNDWKATWFETQKKWAFDKGCPDGVFNAFNIDAKINAAYIVIGLLYGNGDYGKTIDISTRCGLDSDCNPANAGGILGTLIGYSQIPDFWKQGLDQVEGLDFPYLSMSLNKVYEMGARHAIQMAVRNGGTETGDALTVKFQAPQPVALEIGFEGVYPLERKKLNATLSSENTALEFTFTGCGFIVGGRAEKDNQVLDRSLEIRVLVDGEVIEQVKLPTLWRERRHELTWTYDLAEGDHTVRIEAIGLLKGYRIIAPNVLVYTRNDPGRRAHF